MPAPLLRRNVRDAFVATMAGRAWKIRGIRSAAKLTHCRGSLRITLPQAPAAFCRGSRFHSYFDRRAFNCLLRSAKICGAASAEAAQCRGRSRIIFAPTFAHPTDIAERRTRVIFPSRLPPICKAKQYLQISSRAVKYRWHCTEFSRCEIRMVLMRICAASTCIAT